MFVHEVEVMGFVSVRILRWCGTRGRATVSYLQDDQGLSGAGRGMK